MDLVGLTIGVVGLAGQLAKAAADYYKIFDDMSNVGSTYDSNLHKLCTEGLRLKRWEKAWGLVDDIGQGRLNPEDDQYRYATATLARIVAAFASIDQLQAKYGIIVEEANGKSSTALKVDERKARWKNQLSIPLPLRSCSKSPARNANTQLVIPTPTICENDLHLLGNPRILGDKQVLPGLPEEISSMTKAIDRVQ
ncbi:hypothetical protein L211DRAFT_849645 [Terfezia boudieri ATCC MYA-4762]|uniref:Prion-inhibition and propagation HeLo domain-containing protein n=1 Tax=Terfezia boudieri ATCC MYA-4762 TaxID=1051890 RepID=A0A3N4LQ51_9PEZI|nr:hypothetical protein L211DRAFT_849645 [Terfezia boudieri ATCC MYA-4762]